MKIKNRKSICCELNKFCHLQTANAFIEVTEWSNSEGIDVDMDGKHISLTHGELEAINTLKSMLDHGIGEK